MAVTVRQGAQLVACTHTIRVQLKTGYVYAEGIWLPLELLPGGYSRAWEVAQQQRKIADLREASASIAEVMADLEANSAISQRKVVARRLGRAAANASGWAAIAAAACVVLWQACCF